MVGAAGAVAVTVTAGAGGDSGIAGGIGRFRGQAVGAVGERRGGVAPGPAGVCCRAAEQRRTVIDLDRALASAVPVRVRSLALVTPITHRAPIGRERGDARCHRRRGVDGHAHRRRGDTGIAGRIGRRRGQAVSAVR